MTKLYAVLALSLFTPIAATAASAGTAFAPPRIDNTPQFTIAQDPAGGTCAAAASPTNPDEIQMAEDQAPSPVPEPAALTLIGGTLLGLGVMRRKRKRSQQDPPPHPKPSPSAPIE